ncbi:hypothetical protein ACWDA7_41085 [Streptomyces sp. NPDC001156]
MLQRGIDTGEIRGDVDLELSDLIVGPMLSHVMLRAGSSLEEGLSGGWSKRCSKECARAGDACADFGAADLLRPSIAAPRQHWRPR